MVTALIFHVRFLQSRLATSTDYSQGIGYLDVRLSLPGRVSSLYSYLMSHISGLPGCLVHIGGGRSRSMEEMLLNLYSYPENIVTLHALALSYG